MADRKAILLEIPVELGDRLDAWWPGLYPNRRAAITGAIEMALAAHAASEARGRAQAADPHRWQHPWSPDRESDARSRPITADLARELLG